MRRRSAVVVAAVAVASLNAAPTGYAAEEGVEVERESPSGVTVHIFDDDHKVGNGLSPVAYARSAGAAYTGPTIVATTLDVLEDGTPCARFSSVPGDPGSNEGEAAFDNATRLGGASTVCPDSTVDAAGNETPYGAALHAWHELVQLPSPQLRTNPDRAITGLPTYLTISGDQTYNITFGPGEALGYNVTIDATSTYDIDWGDGTTHTGATTQGGPYPHGDIRHSYQHVTAENTIGVTQRWTVHWTATGNGQSLSGTFENDDTTDEAFFTTAELPLEITQIQAVRNY